MWVTATTSQFHISICRSGHCSQRQPNPPDSLVCSRMSPPKCRRCEQKPPWGGQYTTLNMFLTIVCYTTLCYAALQSIMLPYATLCYLMLPYATLHHTMLCYAELRQTPLCYPILHYLTTLRYTTLYVACVHFLAVGGLFSVSVYVSARVFGCV